MLKVGTIQSSEQEKFSERFSLLFHQLTMRLAKHSSAVFAKHNIDIHGARVLALVLENGFLRVTDLVKDTCLPQSTMSHILKRLEKQGLLTRTRQDSDNRTVRIQLTALGTEVATECNSASFDHQVAMLAEIPRQDLALTREVLKRMMENLDHLGTAN